MSWLDHSAENPSVLVSDPLPDTHRLKEERFIWVTVSVDSLHNQLAQGGSIMAKV